MKVVAALVICLTTVLCGTIEERKYEKTIKVPNVVTYPVADDVEKCFSEHKVDNGTFISKYGKDWFYDDDLSDEEKICRFACYNKERMELLIKEAPQGVLDNNATAFDEIEKKKFIGIDRQCHGDRGDVCKYLLCLHEIIGLFVSKAE